MIEIIVSILIILGGFLSLLGAIGILRFPDVYGRLHAATKSATLGVICIMLAVYLYFQLIEGIFSGKILLTIIFVFLTAPVAGFMISRSAYNVGVKLWDQSVQDDLKKALNKGKKSRS
ncbi:Na+/H+ antiporter subunit G [Anaerobacillus alkalidiazotrophicus]|uniref:Na+/H+ antiporter subunit G n=1 Tax=Anaerobacillus alkalidiazotrophicus TaxID=472963 RepID=A0A1S2MBM1_9BACI|nr:monovalent cation/H(+) antiporter subunit G [Anaerobacillus alkalidiazotrophicus]OIJ22089.1 Na+/H+ antiporter subunit G [Anaerobacillus alkalidiazotrophicus]